MFIWFKLIPGWSGNATRCLGKTLTARLRICSTWWTSGPLVKIALILYDFSQGWGRDNHGAGVYPGLSWRRRTLSSSFNPNLVGCWSHKKHFVVEINHFCLHDKLALQIKGKSIWFNFIYQKNLYGLRKYQIRACKKHRLLSCFGRFGDCDI